MQKKSNKNKGLLFQNSNVRTEMLYKNMGKYNMVDDILSPAIGTAYYTLQKDNIKTYQTKGGLLNKTYIDKNVNDILYSINDSVNQDKNQYSSIETYSDYISNTNGAVTWWDKVGSYVKSNELTFEGLKSATLFEDAPGVVRYIQPVLATAGVITTNLNNSRNIDTKLGTLSNLFYGTTLRNAAYLNELRKTKTITPSLKKEFGNNILNLYNLPYLLPIEEETGRVAGFDNGYNGNFINEYDKEISSEYLTEVIEESLNNFNYTKLNPYVEFSQRYEDSNNIYDSVLSSVDSVKDSAYSEMMTETTNKFTQSLRSDFYGDNDNGLTYITQNEGVDEKKNFYKKKGLDGLLTYTNNLFNKGKIETLLNRKGDTEKGKSKGSGVDCRVWTSKTPYTKIENLVRSGDNFVEFKKLQNTKGFISDENVNYLTNNTVLRQDNGFINIVPSIKSEVEVKKCMFSIENLAWKDVKKEENSNFPKYEQGPNGGRIMWFPPYNLKFTENIGVNWESHSFIGRGEQIYTYKNTDRSGTLGFTILIDNPTIIEAYKKQSRPKSEYINFFAGCDVNSGILNENNEAEESINETKGEEQTFVDEGKSYTFSIYFPNNYSGVDEKTPSFPFHYLVYGLNADCGQYDTLEGLLNTRGYEMMAQGVTSDENTDSDKENNTTSDSKYYYRVDNEYLNQNLKEDNDINNYIDNITHKLNAKGDGDTDYTFIDMYVCLEKIHMHDNAVEKNMAIDYFVNNRGANKDKIKEILENIIGNSDYIEEILIEGSASSHGDEILNKKIAENRALVVKNWLKSRMYVPSYNIKTGIIENRTTLSNSINDAAAKVDRRVNVTIKIKNSEVSQTSISDRTNQDTVNSVETVNYGETKTITKIGDYNESDFFEYIASDDTFVKQYTEKIQYFSPAFHSITPEGFNSRLNFIHQCTRQGGTFEQPNNGSGVGNLAFGRAPVCILRVGDFYNTRIIIDSVTIDYETGQWDLNPEGVGVQPMLANINLTFKFIGGSSLGGAINRLQNALSFNYYANTSAFEKRSDMSYVNNGDEKVTYRMIELEDKRNFPKETEVRDKN